MIDDELGCEDRAIDILDVVELGADRECEVRYEHDRGVECEFGVV